MTEPESDHVLARRLASEAGALLVDLRAGWRGTDAALRDAGDARSHAFLVAALHAARPGDEVLSEEGADDPVRLGAARVWIVDPLDGTREFGDRAREDWAVHVALWDHGRLTAGAVARPALGDVLATEPPPSGVGRHPPRGLVTASRTRPPRFLPALAMRIGARVYPLGSAGFKAMAVVDGVVDAYVHDGGQYEWDSAAPVAVALAAGLHASRLDGSPLVYNQVDLRVPDLLICRPELAERIITEAAELRR